jgi:hypothetical protein
MCGHITRRGTKYRRWYRREGRYLLRTNLTQSDPKVLWECYLQLVAIEAAFKNLKDDLKSGCVPPKKGPDRGAYSPL